MSCFLQTVLYLVKSIFGKMYVAVVYEKYYHETHMKGNVVYLLVVVDVSKSFTAVMSFFNFSRKTFYPG